MTNDKLIICVALLLVARVASFQTEETPNEPDLHEGDIKLSPIQRLSLEAFGDPTLRLPAIGRGITMETTKLWPNHVVPYTITPKLAAIPVAMQAIHDAINEWQQSTCLKFVKRTNEVDYIEFYKGYGCWSNVGRRGGKQKISLYEDCFTAGKVMHEIGHAVGFWHEQNRPDRDKYVTIIWENIPEKNKKNFKKQTNQKINSLGFPYDYVSVMHYPFDAFGGGNTTIKVKDPSVVQLGQRIGLSPGDVQQADALYKCNGRTTLPRPTYPPTHNGPDDCTFDSNTCGWSNVAVAGDHYDWARRLGPTPSFYTGPQTDHTTGKLGYYMGTEASPPAKLGDKAILESKNYPSGGVKCFHFYYHMYGGDMGTLSVTYKSILSGKTKTLWSKSGDQGNKWFLASVQLPASSTQYKLSFVIDCGADYEGDAAIDDVYFTDGHCS